MQKEPLFGKTLDELKAIAQQLGLPAYTGGQIAYWLYKTDVVSFDEMSNISKKTRALLAENYEPGVQDPVKVNTSADGTKKYLFSGGAGKFIEAAYIPDGKRHTLCVSSQVGCKMGCLFCMTGKQGFQGQLSAGEILNQLRSIPERKLMTNIVYMGMGEPFDNLPNVMKSLEILTAEYGFAISVRKVTVSTIGIIPAMREFLEKSKCNLAVSLHTPFEDERRRLMPIQNVYPLKDVIETIREFDIGKYRRVSFEYILFKGVNDTRRHVNELARLLNKVRSRINLIRFHEIPGTPLQCSDEAAILDFQQALNDKGIVTTLRASRGQDIEAACGLLSTKELVKAQKDDF
ncbi:MAG TPA: 23S rRNA (adenine(2503)-C(2))-methyltransferase RlmN [Lentimicrobium sp.]|jgi:23S rRNA (adenine2503-C2)-methyltransferase|nr:23S rRNA (adenine(2503)-C(2))-methyltransferase RlmN [Lentimicrobium sp.]